MTDIERREIFAYRAWKKLDGEDVMNYSGFKCALADAERRFIESSNQIHPTPSIPGESGQSAEEIMDRVVRMDANVGKSLLASKRSIIEAMTTYASQVCAEKDGRIQHLNAKCEALITELDAVNESLTVILRKNAEFENELEYAKIR